MKDKIKAQIIKLKKILILILLLLAIFAAIYHFFLKQFIESGIKIDKEIISININDDFDEDLQGNLQNKEDYIEESKEQNEITDLENRVNELELKIEKIDLKDELSILAISFAKLSYLIQQEFDYKVELSKFAALSAKNQYLFSKIKLLENALDEKNYKISEISAAFNDKIDDLILLKKNSEQDLGFFEKIRQNIANLVIIRRVDGVIKSDADKIDAKILKIEQFLLSGSFAFALNEINNIDSKYKLILKDLILMLENQVAINDSIDAIFSYLQKIINNV